MADDQTNSPSAARAQPVPNRKPHQDQVSTLLSSSFGEDTGYHSGTSSLYSIADISFQSTTSFASASSSSTLTPGQYATAPPQSLALSQTFMGNQTVDDQDDISDFDSAYDSESLIGGDTMTLASYITDYRFEHGRRYHAYRDGAYWGPNDDHANEQQDLAHHMYNITLNKKLHLAPISNPHNILDLGTGTGIWAIDMADLYPSAHVLGTDLSPIQPDFIPPNCEFEIDDVTLEWTFPENHFDFIHLREMFGSVADWDELFAQAFRHTKEGGWVEIVEHSVEPECDDGTMPPGHFYEEWGRTVVACGEKVGKSFRIWREAKAYMEKAGFVDVTEVRYRWPMNGWSKDPLQREIGRWNQLRLHDGVEGFMLRLLTNALDWSYERSQVFLAQMRNAVKDYKVHAYLEGTVVYGRKPYSHGS